MSMITRTDFRNALFTLLTDQQTATPDELRKVLRFRPGAMPAEQPAAWIGNVVEALAYDAGTRNREMTAEVIIGKAFPSDLITTADPFDALLDALVERFTNNSGVIASTITELNGIDDGEISFQKADGGINTYRGATLTVRLRIWEGRL
jgi:hypothetical protein